MTKSILATSFLLAAALTLPVGAQNAGTTVITSEPGKGAMAQPINVTATITNINATTREVTLKGPEGHTVTVVAGPEIKNFGQLKVGNMVDVQYKESLVLELKKGGGKQIGRTERVVERAAKPGEKPAGMREREVTIVGDVINVDPATKMVTVKGPQQTVDLRIQDPEQFKLIAKGDQIEARFTEAIAVSVMTAKK